MVCVSSSPVLGPINNHFSVSCRAPSAHPPPPISALQAPALCFQLLQNSKLSQGICIAGQSPPGPAGSFETETLSAELSLHYLLGPAEWRSCQQLWTGTCSFLACPSEKLEECPMSGGCGEKAGYFYENLCAARLHPVNASNRPEPLR